MNAPLLLIIAAALGTAGWFVVQPLLRSRRRRALAHTPFPDAWRDVLSERVPLYARLPPDLRARLQGLMLIFMRETTFVGCNDLTVTDEMRLIIAAYACLLVVNRPEVPRVHFYDDLRSILVYPTAFIVPHTHPDEDGVVSDGEDVLAGQAWDSHRIILSWQDVAESVASAQNVVVHEFAHYLDMEDETMDGAPGLGGAAAYAQWSEVFWAEYERLREAVDAGRDAFLDPYAATEPAEFFAVVTEAFFMQPLALESHHAGLYEQLRKYYRVDPARWLS